MNQKCEACEKFRELKKWYQWDTKSTHLLCDKCRKRAEIDSRWFDDRGN